VIYRQVHNLSPLGPQKDPWFWLFNTYYYHLLLLILIVLLQLIVVYIFKRADTTGRDGIEESNFLAQANRPQLPVGYIINIAELLDDSPGKNYLSLDLTKAPVSKRSKYQCIVDILTKLTEGLDIFSHYGAHRIMQTYVAAVESRYAKRGLFTHLKAATIELARTNKFDLIYSTPTSEYSTRANLKLGFHKVRTILYSTYTDAEGRRIFGGMLNTHQACSLTVKDLRT
jgi:hypothetical protein